MTLPHGIIGSLGRTDSKTKASLTIGARDVSLALKQAFPLAVYEEGRSSELAFEPLRYSLGENRPS